MDDESFMEIDRLGNKNWKNKRGLWHRLDGPAIERPDGSKYWYQDGVLHRLDGPAVERDLRKEWWFCGEKHRLDGPAVECANGDKYWYQNGKLHREDGPAIIYPNGEKAWAINNIEYKTKDSYFNALSEESKVKCLFSEDFLNG